VVGKFKARARRWPGYRRLQDVYYGGRRALETHVVGTRLQEWLWRRRGGDTDDVFDEAVRHPHRALLVERLAAHAPIRRVLEFGCHTGANLFLVGRRFPRAELLGIDISPRAIETGRRRFGRLGVANVRLEAGSIDALRDVADAAMDVVFTDAVLMYVGPDKIERFLAEAIRIAGKAIVLVEWHADGAGLETGWYHDGHWVYDYHRLLARDPRVGAVRVTKIPPDVWGGSGWTEFGAVVEAAC
jgi:ubiquinone/menaquinone biosynthesis C-methylase UbiE